MVGVVRRERIQPAGEGRGGRERAADHRRQQQQTVLQTGQPQTRIQPHQRVAHPGVAQQEVQRKIGDADRVIEEDQLRGGMAAQKIDAVVAQQNQRVEHQHPHEVAVLGGLFAVVLFAREDQHGQQQHDADQVDLEILSHDKRHDMDLPSNR